jgi:predicted MPP superfamily phosphohydrolase
MINFQLISDCHLEHDYDNGIGFINSIEPKADCLIIAGDFMTLDDRYSNLFKPYMETLCSKFKHVVYITGNHEYYHTTYEKVHAIIEDAEKDIDNFTFLNNSSITLEGKKISGSTLWFPQNEQADSHEDWLGDFRYIREFKTWIYENNKKSAKFLKDNMDSDIIVTHHMPSGKSTPEAYQNSPINCYFICDMEKDIEENFKGTWIHGHTHTPIEYKLGNAEVVCNPRGYPDENFGKYDLDYVIGER